MGKYIGIEQVEGGFIVDTNAEYKDNRKVVTSLDKAVSLVKDRFKEQDEVKEGDVSSKQQFLVEG